MTQICLDKRITIFPRWKTLIKFGIGETLNKIVLIKHKDLRDSHNKTDNSHLEGKLNKREVRDYKILIYAKGTTFLSSDLGFWLGLGVRSFPPSFFTPTLKNCVSSWPRGMLIISYENIFFLPYSHWLQ